MEKWEELKAWRREKVDGFKAWKKIADERYVRRRDRYEKQIEAVHEPMKEHARSIWQGGMEKAKTQSRVVKDKLDEFRGRGEMLEVEDPKPRGGMRDRGVSSDKEAGE
ncbi:hypothetical protein PMZ80_008420 [Knufia obscura]|uniref:Uncharacterized protein n=2 Tax=Knufia TaxID=430999 RepID=A0AAN8I670_9EURO|nr:hypothetical protein PMZ80_008420 [Knufia obscura]KAK5951305.1 hypothetical protein OHC33_007723 [Knufia fluminis]